MTTDTAAQVTGDDISARVEPLFAELKANKPGCAVGVYRAGEIVYARGYGVESLDDNSALSALTVFNVASISKQFTAAIIVLLAQERRLSLDDDVRKYIPEFRKFPRSVTLRQMLHQTSGLRDDDTLLALVDQDNLNTAQRLRLDLRQQELNFPPGSEWEYSNTNYFLLAVIVQRVTGRALADVAREKLFVPLGMSQTSMNGDPNRIIAHRAVGYTIDAVGKANPEPIDAEEAGASGLFTSIADLARWDANFYSPLVGGQPLLAAMRSPAILNSGREVGYGLGLDLDEIAGAKREGHGGVTNGFRAEITRVPSKQLGIAVLCNSTAASATHLADEVQSALLRTDGAPLVPAPDLSGLRDSAGVFVDPKTLDTIVLQVDDGRPTLSLARPGAFKVELDVVGPNRFSLGGPRQYALVPASSTAPARLERSGGRSVSRNYLRQDLPHPNAATLRNYAGRYVSAELENDLSIELAGDHLVARPQGRSGWPLLSVDRDGFTTGDLRDLRFKFERDPHGQVVRVTLMSDRVRHLVWNKR